MRIDNIKDTDFITFPVDTDWLIQRNVTKVFLLASKMHQNFIFDTPCSVGSKPDIFVGIEGDHRFDQTDCADG